MDEYEWILTALFFITMAVYYGYHLYSFYNDKTEKTWGEESNLIKAIIWFIGSLIFIFICLSKLLNKY